VVRTVERDHAPEGRQALGQPAYERVQSSRLTPQEANAIVPRMVLEIALLKAKSGAADQLRDGLRAARSVISRATGYRSSVFHQGIENPESFLLHIEWETLEAHVTGFRQGPLFAEWRSHFSHFLDGAPVVTHYEPFVGPA
jgi:heme-degrading monooxygenase HmoA